MDGKPLSIQWNKNLKKDGITAPCSEIFRQVHVVNKKALKFSMSVGDAETESKDVRVWSGAKHYSSSSLFLFLLFLVGFFVFYTKHDGEQGKRGCQIWDEWHITRKILWSSLGETLAEKSDTWYIIWYIPRVKKCVLGSFGKHLRDKICLWLRTAW